MDESFVMSDDGDDYVPSPVAAKPKAKKAKAKKAKKKAGKKKAATAAPMMIDDAENAGDGNAGENRRTSMERAELSNKYQKKTQLEHIMLRPDTYIGSVEKITQKPVDITLSPDTAARRRAMPCARACI